MLDCFENISNCWLKPFWSLKDLLTMVAYNDGRCPSAFDHGWHNQRSNQNFFDGWRTHGTQRRFTRFNIIILNPEWIDHHKHLSLFFLPGPWLVYWPPSCQMILYNIVDNPVSQYFSNCLAVQRPEYILAVNCVGNLQIHSCRVKSCFTAYLQLYVEKKGKLFILVVCWHCRIKTFSWLW